MIVILQRTVVTSKLSCVKCFTIDTSHYYCFHRKSDVRATKSGVPGDPMKKCKICTDAPHRVMPCAVSPMWSGHDMVPQENQVRFVLLEELVFANAQHPERGHLA